MPEVREGGEKVMNPRMRRTVVRSLLLAACLFAAGCGASKEDGGSAGADGGSGDRGSIEVTAKLVEIPDGAIFDRQNYNYATVLKYQVLEVHRGKVRGDTIYVGHYNPAKPRSEAANKYVPNIGGNLKSFRPGQVHRMAMEDDMNQAFTGAYLNLYAEEYTGPVHWAVWTDLVRD
jgi:hypothetical protein